MSNFTERQFDTDTVPSPYRQAQLSSNAHWIFGSIYAGLAVIGFGFGVWAGAAKPKPTETAEAKKDTDKDKPAPKPPTVTPPVPNPNPNPNPFTPPVVEPKKEPDPEPKKPEVKKEPEPKPKDPEPKPKPKDPEVKPPARVVLFKEVQPILRTYCNDCHGGSTGKPKGGIDLTSVAKILKSKGPPLVAGKPMDSTLYTSTKGGDMPPDGKKGPDEKELQLIYDWIAGGAKERRRTVRGRSPVRRKLELTRAAESG
jgi:periplasmic protein TonB